MTRPSSRISASEERCEDSDSSETSSHSSQLSALSHCIAQELSEHSTQDGLASSPLNYALEIDFSHLEVGPDQLQAFTLFPKLPLEIRIKIWESALPRTRLVEIRFLNMPCHFPPPRLPTPSLHVSQEAREVALKRYKPLYRLSSSLPLIYIDPKMDILFINEHVQRLDEVFSELDLDVLRSLRHIALESMMMFVFSNIVGRFFPCLLRLSSLERIAIIVPPTNPESESGRVALFEFFKIPLAEWPTSVYRHDEHLFTRKALEHCKDKGSLTDPRWIRTGFNNITQAVEGRFRSSPGRKPPQVDLKGVRRR